MIVIGVAPGLKALTYSVLEINPGVPAVVIDKDVLLGPKLPGRDDEAGFLKGLVDLAKKAYVHHLILEVVLDRALVPFGRAPKPVGAFAIGPACNGKEPPEHVHAVRVMLTHLAHQFSIPVAHIEPPHMTECLVPQHRENWLRVSNRLITEPLDTKDPKIVLAVAIGLTGGVVFQREGLK